MDYKLRSFTVSDINSIVKYANNPRIARFLTDQFPHPYTQENARIFIANATSQTPRHILAIEINDEASGAIGLHRLQDVFASNAELGYWLAEPYWGKGIMTKVVKEMVDYSFDNFNINRIFARPYGSNIGSQKVLEKAGFVLEARFEKTIVKWGTEEDELVYAVRRK